MKSLLLLALAALCFPAVPAVSVAAGGAGVAAPVPSAQRIALRPAPPKPSGKAQAMLRCNRRRAGCVRRCRSLDGAQRNKCHDGCNRDYTACTQRAARAP